MIEQSETEMRRLYTELQPGDRVLVEHEVKVGLKRWNITTEGTVLHKERRRHSLHYKRNLDDKVWSDVLVMKRDDGELTTVTIDEFTRIARHDEARTP